ncbi:MAG: peptidase S41, partial [Chloroflexi bacterium]
SMEVLMARKVWVAIAVLTIFSVAALAADDGTKLLRFPDIHGDTVVFAYGGDLWSASTDGGSATRLTAHPGQEVFPRFSPDGQWIAFNSLRNNDQADLYLMRPDGSNLQQITDNPEPDWQPQWEP